MSYVVIGRYCGTDESPEFEATGPVVEVGARTLAEAKTLALWYRRKDDPSRDGEIVKR